MNNDDYDERVPEHHRVRNSFLTLALGAVLYGCWRQISRTHQLRLGHTSERLPERLQTWESEGGRPDPDPEPSVATASSRA